MHANCKIHKWFKAQFFIFTKLNRTNYIFSFTFHQLINRCYSIVWWYRWFSNLKLCIQIYVQYLRIFSIFLKFIIYIYIIRSVSNYTFICVFTLWFCLLAECELDIWISACVIYLGSSFCEKNGEAAQSLLISWIMVNEKDISWVIVTIPAIRDIHIIILSWVYDKGMNSKYKCLFLSQLWDTVNNQIFLSIARTNNTFHRLEWQFTNK